MADNFNTKISKTLLAHDIDLAKVDAAMRKDVMAVMNSLEKKTIENVTKLGSPSNYASVSAKNKALNLLVTSQAPTTAKAYKQMSDITGVSLTKLAAVESEFVVNTLNRAITVDLGLNKLSPEVIRLLPGKALIEGAPFTTWFVKQAEDFQLAFSNQMREGIVNGETIDDMVRRVRGTKANGYKDGFVSPKRGHAQTLVRSSVQATANKARESVYAANSNVIKGQQWLSTLDSRTSDICISLDGSAWYLSGKPMPGTVHSYLGPPPAHFNCRSTLLPVTKSFSELAKSKSAKAKLSKIPKTKQRSLRASMDGAVSNKLNYEEWLRTKPPGFQLEVLGPTKLRLWQAGQLSLKNLIDQSHNPLAVDTLVAKTGVPKITLDQALDAAPLTEVPVASQGVVYKSSKQWYDEFADKSATKESVLATQDAATVKKIEETAAKIDAGDSTNITHKVNGKWTAERAAKHDEIIREYLNKATAAAARPAPGAKPSYVMTGGRGSSGKGAFTTPKNKGGLGTIDEDRYIVIDADAIKAKLPGYEGWNAYHFHAESSELMARITDIAARLKLNVVHDITMRGQSAFKRSAQFIKKGYELEGHYMFLPPQTAASRTIQRFKGFGKPPKYDGRYVPPDVVLGMTDNEIAFDAMKKHFKRWTFYDNQGKAPVLVGKGGEFGKAAVKPLATVATKAADDALAASLKAGEGAAADAAKAAAKAADEAMAAKLAQQVAVKEAQLAKAAQDVAEKQAKINAIKAEQIQDAKEEYYAAKLAGKPVPPDVSEALVINLSVDELEVFVKKTDDLIEAGQAKAAKAAKDKARKLDKAKEQYTKDALEGLPVDPDIAVALGSNMTNPELAAFVDSVVALKKTAKEAAEAAAFAKSEATAKGILDKIAAQKATFEKRALIKLQKADPTFDKFTATTQLEKVVAQVEIDKAAKKVTDGISNYKKAVINGKVPPPAATKVFNSLDEVKQQSIIDDIAKKTGQQQVAATPPTLAESLALYDNGKLSNAEWIEAYNKAKGTYTFDVQKTILSAPDTVLAQTAETLAQQATATVVKAQAPAPGTAVAQYQAKAKAIIDEYGNGQITITELKKKGGVLLGENIDDLGGLPAIQKLTQVADDVDIAKAKLTSVPPTITATPAQLQTAKALQKDAQALLSKWDEGTIVSHNVKLKAGKLLGEDLGETTLYTTLQKLKGVVNNIDVAKAHVVHPPKATVTLTKAQQGSVAKKMQDDSKKLVDDFGKDVITAEEFKAKAAVLLGEDFSDTSGFVVFNKVDGIAQDIAKAQKQVGLVEAPATVETAAQAITTKTVAKIQDEAQDFLDKFMFGEFGENEAIEKAAAILGSSNQVPAFLKLAPAGKDKVIDTFVLKLKKVADGGEDAKAAIKKQGLKVADDATPPPKPPPPPEPKPTVQAPQSPVNAAPNVDELTRIGEQAGSNPGGLFQDTGTGQKWYVKTPGTEEIARNEVLAAKLYEKMGIEVPDLHIVQFNGKPSVASKIVDGLSENSTALRAGEVAGVHEGFVADAFLANWDVVGLGYDNLLVKAGRAIRVDTGGALRFRAQGGLKGKAFGNVVDEIDSLRNPANNTQSAGVFGRISDAELKAGARRVANLTDDDITQIVTTYGPLDAVENKALIDTLIARRNDIKKRFKIRAKKQPAAKPPEDLNAPVTNAELQQIDDSRSNGFVLARDKDAIEDQAVLAWNETTDKGVKRSMLQLKIRGDAVTELDKQIQAAIPKPPVVIELGQLDNKVVSTVRGLKHRVNEDLEFDTKILTRINDTIEEHDKIRAALVEALGRNEVTQKVIDTFDETYAIWAQAFRRVRGANGVGGKVQEIAVLPRRNFEVGKVVKIELVPPPPTGGGYAWTRQNFDFEEKRLKNGFVETTGKRVNPVSAGGGWYETKIDGITVRYFAKDTVNENFALQDRLEVIAPGKTHEQGLAVLRKLGINTERATDFDAEELYLRQIMQHATSGSSQGMQNKFASIISELGVIADDGARLTRARQLASEYLKVDDITKTPAYNYRGQYQAFGQGQRHLVRPDITGPEWEGFEEQFLLHHRNTSSNTLPQVIDMVLNSGGNFISTTDKIRRGVALSGMSPDTDLRTGGASYFFTRIKSAEKARREVGIVWKSKHVKRLDSISYNHDAYGEVVDDYAKTHRKTGAREWRGVAGNTTNETIFKNGLSIFDDLDMVVTSSAKERDDILDIFKKHGLTEWPDGRKLTDVVKWKGDNI